MSCWVVPSLAAEIWGVPLDNVLRRIREGEIATKEDGGFTFVDVAPYGPRCERPNLPADQRPATFTVVTQEEIRALCEDLEEDEADDTASLKLGDWRGARKKNGRLRLAPPRFVPA